MNCFDCRFMMYVDKTSDSGTTVETRICNIKLPFFDPAFHSGHREINDKIGCDLGQPKVPARCFGFRG